MLPRPRIRMPIVVGIAVVAVAFVVRSLVLRNGDFRIDGTDAVVFGVVVLGSLLVAWARRAEAREADAALHEPSDTLGGATGDEDAKRPTGDADGPSKG